MSNRTKIRVERLTKNELLKRRGQLSSVRIFIDADNVCHVRFYQNDSQCYIPLSLNGSEREFKTLKSLNNFLAEFSFEPNFVCTGIENRH